MKTINENRIKKQRQKVGEVAQEMLKGSLDYLEGAIELSQLLFQIDIPENDTDFTIFTAIVSETDHLPIGKARQYWSREALERHEPDIQKSTEWAKSISLTQCKSLAERFK